MKMELKLTGWMNMAMSNFVDSNDIIEYSKRNTSDKMPIESKFVNAFVRGIFSDDFNEVVSKLKSKFSYDPENVNEFILITSLYPQLSGVSNLDKYVPLIAYSMKRKDRFVMEKLCELFFGTTDGFEQYSSYEKYKSSHTTDENPVKNTDDNYVTDYENGQIYFSYPSIYYYNNYYLTACTQSDKCTLDDIISFLKSNSIFLETDAKKLISMNNDFYTLVTVIKPARVGIIYEKSSSFTLATEYYFANVNNEICIKKDPIDKINGYANTFMGSVYFSDVDGYSNLSYKQNFICNPNKSDFSISLVNYDEDIYDFDFSVIKDNIVPIGGSINETCAICKISIKLRKSLIKSLNEQNSTRITIKINGTRNGNPSEMQYTYIPQMSMINSIFDTEYLLISTILILRTS